jgi:hypothetical protein
MYGHIEVHCESRYFVKVNPPTNQPTLGTRYTIGVLRFSSFALSGLTRKLRPGSVVHKVCMEGGPPGEFGAATVLRGVSHESLECHCHALLGEEGLGFGVWGLGFRDEGLGMRV